VDYFAQTNTPDFDFACRYDIIKIVSDFK
jgi:hypothetical protein